MPEIKELYKYDNAYATTSFTSPWLFLADVGAIQWTVWCDKDVTLTVNWAIEETNYDIITSETKNGTASSTTEIYSIIRAKFAQFVVTIASSPSQFRSQGFFF